MPDDFQTFRLAGVSEASRLGVAGYGSHIRRRREKTGKSKIRKFSLEHGSEACYYPNEIVNIAEVIKWLITD